MRFGPSLRGAVAVLLVALGAGAVHAGAQPVRARRGMVVSQSEIASRVGLAVLRDGGNAVDAAVATAFALAVTHPAAGNVGGGGFLLYRPSAGEPVAYDFRETAPATASAGMFLSEGKYDSLLHHEGHRSAGVPGTVAGLHLAWKEHGRLPWRRLVEPAIRLARDGFPIPQGLAVSLREILPSMRPYPASVRQFSKDGIPYEEGDTLRQPDLARTLERIATNGPDGFYRGETALLIEKEMRAHGGLVTRQDLAAYQAKRRVPLRGTYRGCEVLCVPPPTSGGVTILEMLNLLEGYDLRAMGHGSAATVHCVTEAMRRAFADRAQYLGDPDFNPGMPVERLISKAYAAELRPAISLRRASRSTPERFAWATEDSQTTHLSVVDRERNAVALTYTLEASYGSRIVVAGAGFLLNNEMGDFNAVPGFTSERGFIGSPPNLAAPGKRMLSSMSPTILTKDGQLFMVTGSPGGRTIISTVLHTILDVVDFGMNAQEAVDAPRFHHQWLPDTIRYEAFGLSPDTIRLLESFGHRLRVVSTQGIAEVILYRPDEDLLEGGCDRRAIDGAALGW